MKVKNRMKQKALKNSGGIKKPGQEKKKFLKLVTDRKKPEDLAGKMMAPERVKMLEVRTKKKKNKKRNTKVDTVQADEGTKTVASNGAKHEEENKETDVQAAEIQVNPETIKKFKKNKKSKNTQGITPGVSTKKTDAGDTSMASEEVESVVENDEAKTKKNKNNKKQKKYVLFLGNLPYDLEQGEVEKHFKVVKDSISRVSLLTDHVTGRGRGCGFLELTTPKAYQEALKLNFSKLQDHKIRVEFTVPGKKGSNKRNKFMNMKTKKILGQSKSKKGKKNRNKKGPTPK